MRKIEKPKPEEAAADPGTASPPGGAPAGIAPEEAGEPRSWPGAELYGAGDRPLESCSHAGTSGLPPITAARPAK